MPMLSRTQGTTAKSLARMVSGRVNMLVGVAHMGPSFTPWTGCIPIAPALRILPVPEGPRTVLDP
jgi:hypothetical protein